MGMHTRRSDGGLRHFLLFQIKHSPLAPKIVRGRGSLDPTNDDDDDSRLMLFLPTTEGTPAGRPTDRFFLSRIISRLRRRCHGRRPTCHYPGQAETIGGISGDLPTPSLSLLSRSVEKGERTMDNRDIYTDL